MCQYPFYLLLFSHSWVNAHTLEFATKSTTGQTEELIESGTEEQQHLVRLLPPGGEEERGSPACCRAPNVLSCSKASVNASLLTSQTSILLPGTNNLLTFANMVPPAACLTRLIPTLSDSTLPRCFEDWGLSSSGTVCQSPSRKSTRSRFSLVCPATK